MRVLAFGTYDTTRHPRIGVIVEGLRALDDQVIEVNDPLGFSTAERVEMARHPWLAYRMALRLTARWFRIGRRARRERRQGRFDAIVVGYFGQLDVLLARLLFPRDTIALDLLIFGADTARDRDVRSRSGVGLLALFDALSARCADIIVLDTVEHLELLTPRQKDKAVIVPVGASSEWFRARGSPTGRPPASPLRVVFYGLFTPLHGTAVIGEALGLLADTDGIEFTMIGRGQDWEKCRQAAAGNPHVTWVDWVEPDRLPGLVAEHDVCLGIFGTTPKSRRVVPNKLYQGAAAGCALVTSDTAAQRRAFADAALLVPPGDAAALAGVLRELGRDRAVAAALGDLARRQAKERFTPCAVVEPLRARVVSVHQYSMG